MNEEIREAIRVSVMATLESCMANYQLAPMLTLEEIAERTQVSKDTIRAAVDAGDLRVYQISARLPRFRVADVNAWIDRLAVAPPAAKAPEDKPETKPLPPPMPPLPEVTGDLSDLSDLTDGVGEAAVVKENLTTGTPARVDEKPSAAEAMEGKPAVEVPEAKPEEPSAAEAMEGKPVAPATEERAAALDDAERCPVCAPDGRRCVLPAGHEGKHRLIKKEN